MERWKRVIQSKGEVPRSWKREGKYWKRVRERGIASEYDDVFMSFGLLKELKRKGSRENLGSANQLNCHINKQFSPF